VAQVVLIPVGSAGDVHAFVALGLALRGRGHRVTVITSIYVPRTPVGQLFLPLGGDLGLLPARKQKPELGTKAMIAGMKQMLRWHLEAFDCCPIGDGYEVEVNEFDWKDDNGICYDKNGVQIRHRKARWTSPTCSCATRNEPLSPLSFEIPEVSVLRQEDTSSSRA
jgi:hypothetical protein